MMRSEGTRPGVLRGAGRRELMRHPRTPGAVNSVSCRTSPIKPNAAFPRCQEMALAWWARPAWAGGHQRLNLVILNCTQPQATLVLTGVIILQLYKAEEGLWFGSFEVMCFVERLCCFFKKQHVFVKTLLPSCIFGTGHVSSCRC